PRAGGGGGPRDAPEPHYRQDGADDGGGRAREGRADDQREPREDDDRGEPVSRAQRHVRIEPRQREDDGRRDGGRRAQRPAQHLIAVDVVGPDEPERGGEEGHGDPRRDGERAREGRTVAQQPGDPRERKIEQRRGEQDRRREIPVGPTARVQELDQRPYRHRVRDGDAGNDEHRQRLAPTQQHQGQRRRRPHQKRLIGRRRELIDLAHQRDRGEGESVEDRDQDLGRPTGIAPHGDVGGDGEAQPDQQVGGELHGARDAVPVRRDHRQDAERERPGAEHADR